MGLFYSVDSDCGLNMSLTHYLDVTLRTPEVGRDLHARLLTAAHHRILAGDALAVAWPEWRHEQGDFGCLFRVFGDADAVGRYADGVAPLTARELIFLTPVAAVPDVAPHVVFARDRGIDRFSPSATRRMTQRAIARGRAFHPTRAPRTGAHALALKSSSTGSIFHLFVRRENRVSTTNGGSRYGLGYAVPDF
jgi:hypothetical protein